MCRGKAYHRPWRVVNRVPPPPSRPAGLLMGPFETIYIDEMVAACNGGEEPLGHPRVYLNLASGGKSECPYCSRLFVNRAMAGGETAIATTPPRVSEERNV